MILNFKKLCRSCGIHNHWQMDETELRHTEFECGDCKRIEMVLDKKDHIIIGSHCSHCNFYNLIEFNEGMQFKLRQYECPHCSFFDMTYGMTMDRKISLYDYDKAHFSENL